MQGPSLTCECQVAGSAPTGTAQTVAAADWALAGAVHAKSLLCAKYV